MKLRVHFTALLPPACFVFCALSVSVTLLAQDESMRWGRIPDADLKMTVYDADPEADAVILGHTAKIEFDLRASNLEYKCEYHFRIKFFTQAGIDKFGDQEITYRTQDRLEAISGLRAQVFLPNGSRVNAGKDNLFTEPGMYTTTEKISFPALESGAVAEYRYSMTSRNMFNPAEWYFQWEIPVRFSEMQITSPEWLDYIILKQGREVDQQESRQVTETVTYGGVQRSGGHDVQQRTAQGTAEVKMNRVTYTSRNVPALKPERHITTMEDYYSSIRYQLRTVRLPNRPIDEILSTWAKIEETLLEHGNFGRAYLPRRHGEAVLKTAGIDASGSGSQKEKTSALMDYLSASLEWNGTTGIRMQASSVSDVLKNRQGSVSDLNLTLLAGLLQLGIDAAPVLTSTRANGSMFELYPFVDQFNYVLVAADLDGSLTLLDLTGAYRPVGFPNPIALNYRGWMVVQDRSEWIDIIPEPSRSTYYFKLDCSPEGALTGTLQARFTGYYGADERRAHAMLEQEYFVDHLGDQARTWKTENVQVSNARDWNAPLEVLCEVSSPGTGAPSNLIYFAPYVSGDLGENPFRAEHREFPVEFNYPIALKYIFDLTIPEGYVVESMPESMKIQSEGGGIEFALRAGDRGGMIQLIIDFSVTQLRYGPDQYAMLRGYFDTVLSTLAEQIVLRKEA